MKCAFEIIKIARPGFWPTHIWFYVLPFAGQNMFGSVAFWIGAVYVCFPMGLLIFGWNDIGDADTDSINPRKDTWLFGASPDEPLRRSLPWVIAAVQIPFVGVFVWIAGWKMLGWFAALMVANAAYNSLGFKRLPVLDLLNQTGYLLVFVLASWLCDVPQLNWPAMTFSALFAMHSHLFGQIMDIDEDSLAGRRSTAVTIGVRRSKTLLVAILSAEAMLAGSYFRSSAVCWFMFAAACFFVVDAIAGPRRYPLKFVTLFFVGWNVVAVATIHFIWRYGLFVLAE